MKKIDWYIIKKFLGTFFFTIALIIIIVIIFDVSEKIDDFIRNEAPFSEIVLSYYLTFIPFFTNMFSPLITFIAVVFFTSKMAYNTEIVAILSSGVSFKRLLLPYIIAATTIALMSFYLANFLIPHTNKIKMEFENKYIYNKYYNTSRDIHVQNKSGEYLYVESFNDQTLTGYGFTWEKFDGKDLVFKIDARNVTFDTISGKWTIHHYNRRDIIEGKHYFKSGVEMDTTLNVVPRDYSDRVARMDIMDYFELNDFIAAERIKGSEKIKFYLVEKYKRVSFPIATIILTLIGAALSSRKIRGGIGLHLAIGITLSFSYIIFMQVSTVFATFGTLSPFVAVWIPNIIFSFIAIYLLRLAHK